MGSEGHHLRVPVEGSPPTPSPSQHLTASDGSPARVWRQNLFATSGLLECHEHQKHPRQYHNALLLSGVGAWFSAWASGSLCLTLDGRMGASFPSWSPPSCLDPQQVPLIPTSFCGYCRNVKATSGQPLRSPQSIWQSLSLDSAILGLSTVGGVLGEAGNPLIRVSGMAGPQCPFTQTGGAQGTVKRRESPVSVCRLSAHGAGWVGG